MTTTGVFSEDGKKSFSSGIQKEEKMQSAPIHFSREKSRPLLSGKGADPAHAKVRPSVPGTGHVDFIFC
jgi:hypothetical protein